MADLTNENLESFGADQSQGFNKIRDLFKVKLFTIRPETKKTEREKRER